MQPPSASACELLPLHFAVLCCTLLYAQADFCSFTDSFPELSPRYTYPKQLLAYEVAASTIKVDGHLDDAAWQEVAFSDDFVDISQHAPPRFRTQVKVRWDREYLYVAARLVEPNTWANITRHNEASQNHLEVLFAEVPCSQASLLPALGVQVVFRDNDFEVFVDADGSNQCYKELEINAKAATWDLCVAPRFLVPFLQSSTSRPHLLGFAINTSRVAQSELAYSSAMVVVHLTLFGTLLDLRYDAGA